MSLGQLVCVFIGKICLQILVSRKLTVYIYEFKFYIEATHFLPENLDFLIFTISVKLQDRHKFSKEAYIGLAKD